MSSEVQVIAYRARKGAPFGDKKAQVYGQELQSVRERRGELTPAIVVEEAEPEQSPLHERFEWDDNEAARKHREWQARYLMNRIDVVVEVKGERRETRAFQQVLVNVETRRPPKGKEARKAIESAGKGSFDGSFGSQYATVFDVSEEPNFREQAIARALGELTRWRKRWADYSEFDLLFKSIDIFEAEGAA